MRNKKVNINFKTATQARSAAGPKIKSVVDKKITKERGADINSLEGHKMQSDLAEPGAKCDLQFLS